MHSPLHGRTSGTNLPLRHLQARLLPVAKAASSDRLMVEASVHSTAELTGSMIDWWIDWLWLMCLPAVFKAQCLCDGWQLIC